MSPTNNCKLKKSFKFDPIIYKPLLLLLLLIISLVVSLEYGCFSIFYFEILSSSIVTALLNSLYTANNKKAY